MGTNSKQLRTEGEKIMKAYGKLLALKKQSARKSFNSGGFGTGPKSSKAIASQRSSISHFPNA
jgi:hypothetical protein